MLKQEKYEYIQTYIITYKYTYIHTNIQRHKDIYIHTCIQYIYYWKVVEEINIYKYIYECNSN